MIQNHRRYELSMPISFMDLFPRNLLQLKYTGKTYFELPEKLFNRVYPSHYCRIIRSISLTIPCVVGPYSTISCTLTLLGSKIRIKPHLLAPSGHCSHEDLSERYRMQEDDDRFVILPGNNQAMATSKGIQDSGMFQLNYQDEQLLRFENQGVVDARFCIEMPIQHNHFPMETISDIVMDLNYTAKEGGPQLAEAARSELQDYFPYKGERLLCMNEIRPDDWYHFQEALNKLLALYIGRQDFAYIPGAHQLFVDQIEVFIETVPCVPCDGIDVYFQEPEDSDCIDCDDTLIKCVKADYLGGLFHGVLIHHFQVNDKTELIGHLKLPEDIEIKRVYLLLTYGCKWLDCDHNGSDSCNCNS